MAWTSFSAEAIELRSRIRQLEAAFRGDQISTLIVSFLENAHQHGPSCMSYEDFEDAASEGRLTEELDERLNAKRLVAEKPAFPKTEPAAWEVRAHFEEAMIYPVAGGVANVLLDMTMNTLDEYVDKITMADSLAARIMLMRGHLVTVVAWWAEITKVPPPIIMETVLDLVTNPPANWEDAVLDVRTGEKR